MVKAYIGLDAHKDKIVTGVAEADGSDAYIHGSGSSDAGRFVMILRKLLKKHGWEKREVRICYEAGPCGFALVRHLRRLEFDTIVIAPSLIPQKSGDRVKTDKRDAKKLARLFRAGELTTIHIPDKADEVIRDLCRARTDAVDAQTRARQRLMAFLLRNGHHYTGRSNWTDAHRRYLRELVLNDPIQKLILEEYLQSIDMSAARVQALEEHMRIRLETWSRLPLVKALQGMRGFQMVASMVIVSELGDLTRFDHPGLLMAYLGLVPSENSSNTKRQQGPITKCGNSHARWMLVEVAHHYRMSPKISKGLTDRQAGLSAAVRELSWRAQRRLNYRYVRLKMRRLHENKVKVAVARELAAFIWELAHIVEGRPLPLRHAA